MVKVYSYFDRPPRETVGGGKSMCDDSFKDEVDINRIVARYKQTGLMAQPSVRGFFEDVSNLPDDLMGAHEKLREAEEGFRNLPSEVRKMFENNPLMLLSALSDPARREAALEALGPRKEAPPPPGAEGMEGK